MNEAWFVEDEQQPKYVLWWADLDHRITFYSNGYHKPPNWFHRLMWKWLLGVRVRIVKP